MIENCPLTNFNISNLHEYFTSDVSCFIYVRIESIVHMILRLLPKLDHGAVSKVTVFIFNLNSKPSPNATTEFLSRLHMATEVFSLRYQDNVGHDRKILYTPTDRTKRVRHFTRRTHDNDIKPEATDRILPITGCRKKEPSIRQNFVLSTSPTAIDDIARGHFKMDRIEVARLIKEH